MVTKDKFDKELKRIVKQLIKLYKPQKIILFGSLAKGDKEAKDIDLFIIKQNPPKIGVERIRELDKLINYEIATDFIVYTPEEVKRRIKLKDPFIKSILEEGKLLYEAKK